MKKSVFFTVLLLLTLMFTANAQSYGNAANLNNDRTAYNTNTGQGPARNQCRKGGGFGRKNHMRKMRRMAGADGRITRGEKRMLRRERRRF